MAHRFYRQVTYDEQLQEYVFTDNNALVLVEPSIYVIFHEPQGETLDMIQNLGF